MYFNARYYDPEIGRFVQADTEVPDYRQTQAFNRYMFVAGNPISFVDASGHNWLKKGWHAVTNAVTGAAKASVAANQSVSKWVSDNRNTIAKVAITTLASVAAAAVVTLAAPVIIPAMIGAAGLSGSLAGSMAVGAVTGGLMGAAVGATVGAAGAYASNRMFGTNLDIKRSAYDGAIAGGISGVLLGGRIGYASYQSNMVRNTSMQQISGKGKFESFEWDQPGLSDDETLEFKREGVPGITKKWSLDSSISKSIGMDPLYRALLFAPGTMYLYYNIMNAIFDND